MKLYHFLSEKYGIESIRKQRLKVSFLDDLNDPFELLSVNFADPEIRSVSNKLKKRISEKFTLLCFSKSWKSPLLWSHYGDRHKGVALEIDADDEMILHITYQKQRKGINKGELREYLPEDFEIALLTTKFKQWEYEDEARIFLLKNDVYKDGQLYFYDFDDKIKLTGIITGSLCSLDENTIKSNLPKSKTLHFIRSRLAYRTFDIVKNIKYKIRKIEG